MWIENLDNGKFKYSERYKDEYGRTKKVSVTLDKCTSRSRNEAIRLLSDKIAEKLKKKETSDIKFWDIVPEWQKIAEQTLKASTLRSKATMINTLQNYIDKNMLLSEINRPFVHDILEDIYYHKKFSFSFMTANKALISNVFEYAISKGYTVNNPTEKLIIPRKKETLEEREKHREKYLEQSELTEVITLASQVNTRWANLIEFLALTGLRQGEAFGLQIKNIDSDRISITGTYDRQAHIKTTPKNKYSERVITLPKRAIEILQETITMNMTEGRSKGAPDDYIFVTKSGVPIYDSAFNRLLHSLNYKKNLSSHIFRHTHIALLTELGIPIKAIMDRVGHNEPKTTLSIYSHVTRKLSESVVEKLNTIELKKEQ